ncbi:MAG: 5-formyltetrahydrofolate cyclo-ligase [Pseudomonadales bacterium]|nr:5-formyltetrahydrofolate cyclo-ligase [Pseudomonadales bacterium]NIX08724.1 5-formyltetrahydrofolate cyclo-ligase [Pseudomonadales bacterium]
MQEDVTRFGSKADARQWAWDALNDRRLARFPFPPHGRIPNFVGAAAAAERIFAEAPFSEARAIKVNPDSPQLPVRLLALQRGIQVFVPTPKLAAGFNLLDPAGIPTDRLREAAALKTMLRWAQPVDLEHLPQLDAIVTGCAAVTPSGKRVGKGAGYSDLEFAILRELGHRPVPVATTVHDVQLVDDFPIADNDLPLSLICTPTRTIRVRVPPAAPVGVQWGELSAEQLAAMPVLASLRSLKHGR